MDQEKKTKEKKNLIAQALSDFKDFALKGSVVDLAVGVVIGGAFSRIITSLAAYIIVPLIGLLIGGVDFSMLSITVGNATIRYGAFLQAVADFMILALCLFFFVKLINSIKAKTAQKGTNPDLTQSERYLKQIRDLLQEQKKESGQ